MAIAANGLVPPAHPRADDWPMLRPDELARLAEDIARHGLRQPLVVWIDDDGHTWLLDGRNRAEACRMAGVEPTLLHWQGDDPAAYVLSANDHRRHLTPSQRAMAVSASVDATEGGDHSAKLQSETTADTAAGRAGVSPRLVSSALYVRQWAPDLIDAVLAGTIRVSAAEDEARRRVAKALADAQRTTQLAESDPDLAELLDDDGELSLPQVERASTERVEYARREAITGLAVVSELVDRLAATMRTLDIDLGLQSGGRLPDRQTCADVAAFLGGLVFDFEKE